MWEKTLFKMTAWTPIQIQAAKLNFIAPTEGTTPTDPHTATPTARETNPQIH